MSKQTIEIRIGKDGTIQSETHGIKGRKCMKYMEILQELLNAQITDSEFTPEYLMSDIYETEKDQITLGEER